MAHIEDRWERIVDGRRGRSDRYGTGNRWRARWFDPDGRERSRSFARKLDAEQFLAGVESDKSRGLYVDPAAGRITLAEYAKQWQAAQVHRASSADTFDSHLRNHIVPTLGRRPLASITRSEVQAFVKGRAAVLAPSTVGTVYAVLRMVMRAAVADRIIGVSPCDRIALPKEPPREVVPLPHEAVAGLVSAVPDRYHALILAAAGTGLRQGELFGLRRDRVDFLRRHVVVDAQLVLLARRPPYLAAPKTNAGYRTVPVPDSVLTALTEHFKNVEPATALDEKGQAHELVFANGKGGPISRTWFHRAVWSPALLAVGLPKGTHFHELRHYYASLLIDGGESVKVVQKRLGHASAEETLNTYAHLWPDSEDRTRAVVEAALVRVTDGGPAGGVIVES